MKFSHKLQIHPPNQFPVPSKERWKSMDKGEDAKGQISLMDTSTYILNKTPV